MGWIKEEVQQTNKIFKEIIGQFSHYTENGRKPPYNGCSTPYEFWSDYIRDNYNVTLKQCDELCRRIKKHFGIKEFYYNEIEAFKNKRKNK